MVGLPRAIIKKYGVTKKAWAVYRGGGGSYSSNPRRRSRGRSKKGGFMAKRKYFAKAKRYIRSGGVAQYAYSALIGTTAGIIAPRVPVLNTLPYSGGIAGALGCFLLGQKTMPKLAVGAATGQFVSPMVGNALNNMTGMRIY